MKNYLNRFFKKEKIENLYDYYKALSYYTQKQRKYKFINFLYLIKYIIFEEVSYLLKLKPRIMNELEAEKLKEEAKAYIGKTIYYESRDPKTKKWVKVYYRYDGSNRTYKDSISVLNSEKKVIQQEKIKVQIWATLMEVDNEKNIITPTLKSVVDRFKTLNIE